jgi:hypothetical protein
VTTAAVLPARRVRRVVRRVRRIDLGRPVRPVSERPLPLVRRDTLPDGWNYADTGCELSATCLRCPLARCQYDVPNGARAELIASRDREIALLRRRHGAPIDMLAGTYGLTRRHIFRILREQAGG